MAVYLNIHRSGWLAVTTGAAACGDGDWAAYRLPNVPAQMVTDALRQIAGVDFADNCLRYTALKRRSRNCSVWQKEVELFRNKLETKLAVLGMEGKV
ncbi:hypothetical protein [Neisseria perflava]|uniref:hypothetical protein n=1 Tax=Neisseria perflava TaxID=33053 RepID=UPI00209C75AE|nr:hypothetical protein [Neisseria perflava]MCP1659309.1 hypothetical protein [Neisseria perflava]MCP1772888.1 hypothetical protein [Neisseria perflava]